MGGLPSRLTPLQPEACFGHTDGQNQEAVLLPPNRAVLVQQGQAANGDRQASENPQKELNCVPKWPSGPGCEELTCRQGQVRFTGRTHTPCSSRGHSLAPCGACLFVLSFYSVFNL